jgi:hypothetical protein
VGRFGARPLLPVPQAFTRGKMLRAAAGSGPQHGFKRLPGRTSSRWFSEAECLFSFFSRPAQSLGSLVLGSGAPGAWGQRARHSQIPLKRFARLIRFRSLAVFATQCPASPKRLWPDLRCPVVSRSGGLL